jgi:DNA-binding NtrC family response regulator
VLIVEDEHAMRALLVIMLEKEGYRVFEAADANEARNIWRRENPAIRVLLSDVWLPEITGPELAREFRSLRPGLSVLYISGMSPPPTGRINALIGNSPLLTKPFTTRSLIDALRRVSDTNHESLSNGARDGTR